MMVPASESMKVKVWDLPLRAFHWLLATAVAVAFISAEIGGNAMIWHGRAGLAVVGLLAFRIVWGFVGSTYARFVTFLYGPTKIRAYLKGEWDALGHNPIGAFSVLALLTLLTAEAVTGLFANDDISYQGYLYSLVGTDLSGQITGLHKLFEPALIVLVTLHLAAIAFYMRVKKRNLVKPMITGWKEVTETVEPPPAPKGGGLVAFAVAAAIGLGTAYFASGELLPPPPPEAAVETPAF